MSKIKRELKVVQVALPSKMDEAGRLDRVSLVLAGVLFISPWALGFADMPVPARTAWISAIVIALISALATLHFSEWEEWVNLATGAWLVAAPWVLKFHFAGDAVGAFTAIGAIISIIALSEIWEAHHPNPKPLP